MTRICNFPIGKKKRCKQPVADGKPNCGRHSTELAADQLGQNPTVYKKDGELHVWAGEPDDVYCLIHSDPAHQVLYQLAGERLPCCLKEDIEWRDDNYEYHNDDGPAVIRTDGTQEWYQHGHLHRDDGPAWIWADGTQVWCQRGERHRDDGPALIGTDGKREWYQHGDLHRDDEPAVIESDGTRKWYQHGKLHRDDGPAFTEPDGTQHWCQHGELHREDGPAVIRADGSVDWYWRGNWATEEKHNALFERFGNI